LERFEPSATSRDQSWLLHAQVVMARLRLSGWQIVTLIMVFAAVIAISAVALILGKDAVIALAVVLVACIFLISWFLDLF
jgi:hypothetical protein